MTTPDDDLIERVALRLLNVFRERNGLGPTTLEKMMPEHRAEWMDDARAAIDATLNYGPEDAK